MTWKLSTCAVLSTSAKSKRVQSRVVSKISISIDEIDENPYPERGCGNRYKSSNVPHFRNSFSQRRN